MERGVFCMGFYSGIHGFHPVLPPKTRKTVEDLVDLKATALFWSLLGSGSLSLANLELEAESNIDWRSRFYGQLTDKEFIKECDKHGIKVFSVVWTDQGWEYPVEINENEDEILSWRSSTGKGKKAWWGLREFSQDKYPRLYKSFNDYFPDGLRNSDGRLVEDLIEECACRDTDGKTFSVPWVLFEGEEHKCYFMCRNNPVWRTYLKKIIEIQIDCGVHGIHLDESENPLAALWYGGCFCKDCLKGFNLYLRSNYKGKELARLGIEGIDNFNYGKLLRERDIRFDRYSKNKQDIPLLAEYRKYLCIEVTKHFKEMADFIRNYGKKKGKQILVAGNFWQLEPSTLPLIYHSDIIAFEGNYQYPPQSQAPDYRLSAALGEQKKPVSIGLGVREDILQLMERVDNGLAYDVLKVYIADASAFQANFMIPYGIWKEKYKGSFTAPKSAVSHYQHFLAENSHLYSMQSSSLTAIIYSYPSIMWFSGDEFMKLGDSGPIESFKGTARALTNLAIPYDVVIFGDDILIHDKITPDILNRYELLILPDCPFLTEHQMEILGQFKGKILILGRFATHDLKGKRIEPVSDFLNQENVHRLTNGDKKKIIDRKIKSRTEEKFLRHVEEILFPNGLQIKTKTKNISCFIQRLAPEKSALHMVNFNYVRDRIMPIEDIELKVRLPHGIKNEVDVFSPDDIKKEVKLNAKGKNRNEIEIKIPELKIYSVILIG